MSYITIHDGYDVSYLNTLVENRATKQWNLDHWVYLVKEFKREYPGYKIFQLGSKTSRPIKGVHHNLISKTTITEAFDIISNSRLHIDGDSGLMHAATKMNVPCITLWGPTPMDFYGYRQNVNIKSSVCSHACYGLKEDWNNKCPIGYDSPKCMDAITPEQILLEIKKVLLF